MTRYATGAYHEGERQNAERLALGLGWFSIALGVAELSAPGSIARLIGVRDEPRNCSMLRALGAREIGHGLGILTSRNPTPWVWSRVGGDAVDVACVAAMTTEDGDRTRLGVTSAALLAVGALDVICARQLSALGEARPLMARSRGESGRGRAVVVEEAVTVNRPIEQVYDFWRDFQNLPRFMRHLESVEVTSARQSRWRATAPAGMTVTWEAEITEERPHELLAWRSLEGSDVYNSGSVYFRPAPGARGTEIRVRLEYQPPAGAVGRGVAWLFGEEPEQQIHEDLHRFKQLVETGEIPLSDGPGLWRPAQPAADPSEITTRAGVQR